jgi:hypothetical protein
MERRGNEFFSKNLAFQQEVLDYFNQRIIEIDLFFTFIDAFESVNPAQLIFVEDNIDSLSIEDLSKNPSLEITIRSILKKLGLKDIDIDLVNIFKANSILLIYNLIESTISNANSFIITHINDAKIEYKQATSKIQALWLEQNIKDKSNQRVLSILQEKIDPSGKIKISNTDSKDLFQGNLDSKVIDRILDRYGITTTKESGFMHHHKRKTLQNVKDWRNDLAHGKFSFADFGRSKIRYKTPAARDNSNDILFIQPYSE